MTKGRVRMRLKMGRKDYYLKFFSTLYKKFLNSIILKNNNPNTIWLVVDGSNFYNLVSNIEKNSITKFKILNDICVIDYPEKVARFELNYNLLSVTYNFRVFLKTYSQAYIPSISSVFEGAN